MRFLMEEEVRLAKRSCSSVNDLIAQHKEAGEPFELFFEMREDAQEVICACVYGYMREIAGEPKELVVQIETALIHRETKVLRHCFDNDGFLSGEELPLDYWTREDLEAIGVHAFEDLQGEQQKRWSE